MTDIVIDFDDLLRSLRDQLATGNERLVLVESCTAGIASGLLGKIPGISRYLCGSLVVYRTDSKHRWLGIAPAMLEAPGIGPVSPEVTQALAVAALERTPEATVAAAVTGHLGPDAPPHFDGRVFTSVVRRRSLAEPQSAEHRLLAAPPIHSDDWTSRQKRQLEAAQRLFAEVIRVLGD